jgi:polyhydroxyalkanoate synthase
LKVAVLADILEEYRASGSALPAEAEWLSSLIVSRYLKGEWNAPWEMAGRSGQQHIEQETLQSLTQFFKGMQACYQHPYRRTETEALLVWQEGSTRLFDYGGVLENKADAPVALFIPSLINRSYILDLNAERSLLCHLQQQHIHAYLIDWGEPELSEYGFSCVDYIHRIGKMLALLTERHGRKVALVGYCMGGLMALAAAFSNKDAVGGIGLLATPWDFHSTRLAYPASDKATMDVLATVIAKMEKVPRHLIQAFFYSQNPQAVYEKFTAFAQLDPASQEAYDFVAVERWVGDGISVTCPVARECLIDWGYHNQTLRGQWHVDGQAMHPTLLTCPVFIAMAEHDHIVPPASTWPLLDLIPRREAVTFPAGHVGMVIGRTARQHLWKYLTDWLRCTIK